MTKAVIFHSADTANVATDSTNQFSMHVHITLTDKGTSQAIKG